MQLLNFRQWLSGRCSSTPYCPTEPWVCYILQESDSRVWRKFDIQESSGFQYRESQEIVLFSY
jgi:hypothetical protein